MADADQIAGGLSAAAATCALAASLLERIARDDASVLAIARRARSEALRGRLLELVERAAGGEAGAQTASTSLAIASAAAQLTSIAAECALDADDAAVTEAAVAAELADGACRACVHIVRIGLRDSAGDPRRTEAAGLVSASAAALAEVFAEAAERARPE